ncbi:glycosyltransferase family 4 protein [Mesorhizobium sp. ASY16-5R]|uniref:glycosyltransferase family 4 protein n=1 Tax=Mesorhizobium sp. ASY16-5R TaxID=3445772 RepID=UPI003FA01AF6
MRIAFHAPLKPPDHPVPSGDRLMARLLMQAMRLSGHTVSLASRFRGYASTPEDFAIRRGEGEVEAARLATDWRGGEVPDLFFCYHTYYKAPDYLGPPLAKAFGIPYVTAEASYTRSRDAGPWAEAQGVVRQGLERAALSLCFTERDREGLAGIVGEDRLAMLPPFIDTSLFGASALRASSKAADEVTPNPSPQGGGGPAGISVIRQSSTVLAGAAVEKSPSPLWGGVRGLSKEYEPQQPNGGVPRLVTVAMMRPGDKLDSYRLLAATMALCVDLPWTLVIVGDGPSGEEVRSLFAAFEPGRIEWFGERKPEEIPRILAGGDIYVWPGFGEAFGLAYLEAQAAGLPVVAMAIAGVPEVVRDGETGLLTPPDADAYAGAIRRLLADAGLRRSMGADARCFVLEERSLERAATTLKSLLARFEP